MVHLVQEHISFQWTAYHWTFSDEHTLKKMAFWIYMIQIHQLHVHNTIAVFQGGEEWGTIQHILFYIE